MRRALAILLCAGPALAETPDTPRELARVNAELRQGCERGDAKKCLALGNLADSDYTVMATDFHHDRDPAEARRAYSRALQLLDGKCRGGDGVVCDSIARIYFSEAMHDREKHLLYLERACAARYAWSCFDRGQMSGRSKSATVKWYAEACRLKESTGCRDLSMVVLSSLLLDPVEGGAMNGKALREILESSAEKDERPMKTEERGLALAVARLWSGDRKGALEELAAADAKVDKDEQQLHIFAAYAELVAADGLDRPRARRAWERLQSLVPMRDGKYREQELESDYAWADPTAMMVRALKIAERNR
jgi:hypothetical protein